MIDLTNIKRLMCYPPALPPRKGESVQNWCRRAVIFEMPSGYIVWSVERRTVLAEKLTKFGLKRAIKKLEKQGWIIEKFK